NCEQREPETWDGLHRAMLHPSASSLSRLLVFRRRAAQLLELPVEHRADQDDLPLTGEPGVESRPGGVALADLQAEELLALRRHDAQARRVRAQAVVARLGGIRVDHHDGRERAE